MKKSFLIEDEPAFVELLKDNFERKPIWKLS